MFALLALAISAFGIGTAEFISVGLLSQVSNDLSVSVTTAALTVSLYALGATVGAPILTALTSRIPRKTLLLILLVIFVLGNTIAALSTSFTMLLFARIITALSHGVFMSIGATLAASLVPENKRASAIAIMFTGLTVATITGVPIGTFLGQLYGWKFAFVGIAIIGVIGLIANSILLPSKMAKGAPASLMDMIRLVTNGRLLLVFIITALGYGGTFVVFTYLSPLLEDVMHLNDSSISLVLLVYGIAITIGNIIGGKASNKKTIRSLLFMFLAQAIILFVLAFTIPFKVAGLITLIILGLFAFMNVPGLQVYAVTLAQRYVPNAVDVVSAINIAAFFAGITLGSYLGGVVTDSIGLSHTPWVGAIMVLLAVVLTGWNVILERKNQSK
ncbi:MFS transporter [Paenibacillus rhizosphaerae]|nr:MFS transporter [Paenibacillus rhizosphaerae]